MKKIKFLLILFWNKCSFLHYDRKLLLKLSKCNFLNVSGICNFYTCKKLLYWKQSSIVRHFCPTSPMDPIFYIWAVVTCTKAWGKYQGDKWLFTNCQKNEPNLMLGLLSIQMTRPPTSGSENRDQARTSFVWLPPSPSRSWDHTRSLLPIMRK